MSHPSIELRCSDCRESLYLPKGDEKPDQFIDLVESYNWHQTDDSEWLCEECWAQLILEDAADAENNKDHDF